jgi:4-hydroxybenzoate polyprenyltransferase
MKCAQLQKAIPSMFLWLRALRIHQWTKNILLFVPMFVGHVFTAQAVAATALGFALFCLLSSATYIINDVVDLEADRAHPTKRLRPFARGALKVAHGGIVAALMIVGALIGAYLLAPTFAASMLAYLALTLAYSYRLKRAPLLDVFIIGVLFTLRIVMGAEILGIAHSPWLLSFALAFFLSLALAKRHAEVMAAADSTEEIAGRGYLGKDWPITLTFGVGFGLASIVIMLLYMANDAAPSAFYHQLGWLYAIPALMTVWLMRVWFMSHRELLHDDPVVFALGDPISLLLGAAVAIAFYLAI